MVPKNSDNTEHGRTPRINATNGLAKLATPKTMDAFSTPAASTVFTMRYARAADLVPIWCPIRTGFDQTRLVSSAMALLKLDMTDRYAEIDLTEDSEVNAAELEAWLARGNVIRECGFVLKVTGAPEWKPPEPKRYRRGDMSMGRMRRTR